MKLLLLGGGHSHVEVLRRLAAQPACGAEVVLVSPSPYLPYTGMLPGHIAGHYDFEDCHIDLAALCRSAHAAFVCAEACALDPVRRSVRLHDRGEQHYDLISLDVGSVPDTASTPGASVHAVPVRPVPDLLTAWERMLEAARQGPRRYAVVGGGAGGVELALAMDHRLRRARAAPGTTITVVTDAAGLLPGHPDRARRTFGRVLRQQGIAVRLSSRVVAVRAGELVFEDGQRSTADAVVWATSAAPHPWLSASGLVVDARGFVVVDDALRSVSHPEVFAAGDCASLQGHALPKSGVYAVRQGPSLAANLLSALGDGPLRRYSPQRRALALISTGGKHAVATWGSVAFGGRWVWRWKDRIDRRFVERYRVAADNRAVR